MLVNYKGLIYKLPDVFIVGVQKSGTTTLANYLMEQDGFFTSKKEPHYFAPSFFGNILYEKNITINGLRKYSNIYKKSMPGELIIDASTHYFYHHSEFIKKIKEIYGEKMKYLKIIISLREPASRMYSAFNYLHIRKKIDPREKFETFILKDSELKKHLFEMSFYAAGIAKFIMEFESKNILILSFDDIKNNPQDITSKLQYFISNKIKGNLPRKNVGINFEKKIYKFTYDILHYCQKMGSLLCLNKINLLRIINNYLLAYFQKNSSHGKNLIKNKVILDDIRNKYFIDDIKKVSLLSGDKKILSWIKKN